MQKAIYRAFNSIQFLYGRWILGEVEEEEQEQEHGMVGWWDASHKVSPADTHTGPLGGDSSPKTRLAKDWVRACNSILDFMRDKYEVQTFLCSCSFYAASGMCGGNDLTGRRL